VNDDSQTWERIAAEIKAGGLPDVFNRWLTMTPELLASNEAAKRRIMEGKLSAHSIGPKEQALRAQRTVPPSVVNGAAVASEAKPAAETKKPEAKDELRKLADEAAAKHPITKIATGKTASKSESKKESAVRTATKKAESKSVTAKPNTTERKLSAKQSARRESSRNKAETLVKALQGKNGLTNDEMKKLLGTRLSASSMRIACETRGLKLKIDKKEGQPTRYFAV